MPSSEAVRPAGHEMVDLVNVSRIDRAGKNEFVGVEECRTRSVRDEDRVSETERRVRLAILELRFEFESSEGPATRTLARLDQDFVKACQQRQVRHQHTYGAEVP